MSVRPRALLFVSAVLVSATSGLVLGQTDAGAATNDAIKLVHQDLALAADATLDVTVQLDTPLAPGDEVVVAAYQLIDSRQQLTQAIEDDPRHFADSVNLDPTAITENADGTSTLHIPTESTASTAAALQFPTAGLYPIVIDVHRNNRVMAELLTFVDRQPAAADDGTATEADPSDMLNVAVIGSVSAPPAIPGGPTALPADAAASVQALAAYSQFGDLVRPTLSLSPELLTSNRIDSATLAQVQAVISKSVVLSQPQVPFDPSAAVAASQRDRFVQYLTAGENSIIATTEAPTAEREIWVSSNSITSEGASMLRDLGFRVLVISSDAYRAAQGNRYGVTDFSQLLQVNLPDGSVMPMGVVDPGLNDRLLDTRWASDEQAALYVAADLVAWRDQLTDQETPVTGHTVLFGLSNGGIPNPIRVKRIAEMASGANAAVFSNGLTNYETTTHYQLIDGVPINVTLSPHTPVDLNARADNLNHLTINSTAVSSMLVQDGGRTTRWKQTTDTLWSTALTDADVQSQEAALNAELDGVKSSVVPPQAYSFSLSGRRATVPLRIANQSAEPLQVVISLSAAAGKLETPLGPQLWTLRANGVTDVKVPVVARTNGSFDVQLDISTPTANLPVTETTTLRANVSTLTGLAQVLTGAGLLILATWWVRNLRRNRRSQSGLVAKNGHPSRQPDAVSLNGITAPTPVVVTEAAVAVSDAADVDTVAVDEVEHAPANVAANGDGEDAPPAQSDQPGPADVPIVELPQSGPQPHGAASATLSDS